jgi:alpha-D-ribose 1-methylphosphonate 5-triphosphate diphosphatase
MWLNNVKLVLKDRVVPCAQVHVENGIFTEIIESYGRATPRFTVIPGLIDLHTGILKRDQSARAGSRFPTVQSLFSIDHRLASAGVTLAYAAIDFTAALGEAPAADAALGLIDALRFAASGLHTEFRIHGRFGLGDADALPLIERLLDSGDLHLISFLNRSLQRGASPEIDHYWKSMAQWASHIDITLDERFMRVQPKQSGALPMRRGWDHQLRNVVAAASAYGVPVASHDDDTVEKIDLLAGMGVSISEFPVTIEAAARASARGMHVIMGAPNAYRGRSARGNLSAQEAARRGILDILATDYFPPLLLQAAYTLVECGILSLSESINLISLNPARALGLHDRGHIAIGTQADFVVLEEGYLPRVRATYSAGKAVYSDGTAIPAVAAHAVAG